MKKVLALILAIVLTLSLVGCDGQPSSSDTESDAAAESSSAESIATSSIQTSDVPTPNNALNHILNSTKALAFSHYNGGKVQDWFLKESDVNAVLDVLSDLEITSIREYNKDTDYKSIGDFVLYFSKTNEENHSTASKIYFGEQTVLNLSGLEYVVETTNADDIVSRLTTVIDDLIYENFLKIDGEIKSSNEVLNDILKRTKFIEYSCYDIGEAGGDTKDENLFVLLNVLSDFEITNMREYNKDTDEYYTGDFIVYLSENTENTSSHFVQINISSQIILFPDQTGYVFESPNIKDIDDRLYHEFQRIILRRMMQEMNGKL